MRVIIPDHAGPDSFADNVAFTLREMGHQVATFPAARPGKLIQLYRRARQKLGPDWLDPRERWLLATARELKPDLVLALTQCLHPELLHQLRISGVRRLVAWWADAPANLAIMGRGLLSEDWDLVCLKDPDGVSKFRRVGIRAELLHEAMNPAWHRPVAAAANDHLAVVGNYYGYRQYLLRKLDRAGVPMELHGSRPPRWSYPEIVQRHSGRMVFREDKSRVFGEALAVLNSTSIAEGNSLNCRAFEVAGAGGLQLLEPRPIIQECFEPGRELLVFDGVEEILEKLAWAKRDPAGAKRIREAGMRRAHAHHTYRQRLEKLLAWIAG